ncbi:acyltransferase [Iodobacter sp. HSC-16F04]|uniref:Acyltransferase n=1 Tax=Iodobacter violaceini TaxID=3044271 RepID=A0ABX0L2T4_9NEIS|nr:acyltransferase [Iodobacter violacea]NHQ88514.1 acyltransferase [Iodobacter violacea]
MLDKKEYKFWLDTIRFAAAFIVVLAHAKQWMFGDYGQLSTNSHNFLIAAFYAICRIGNEAVIVFFVLSGYLVGGANINRMLINKFNFIDYLVDRFLRIYVPFIPALLFSGVIAFIFNKNVDFIAFFGNIFQLQGIFFEPFSDNGPLWSLAYECWFYVLLPVLYYLVRGNKFSLSMFFILIVFFAVFVKLDSVYLYSWLIGAVAFFNPPVKFKKHVLFLSILLMLIGVVLIQISTASKSIVGVQFFLSNPLLGFSKIIFSAGCAFFIRIVSIAEPQSLFLAKLEHCGSYLAKFSFTLYLTHYPVIVYLSPYFKIDNGVISVYSFINLLFLIFVCVFVSYLFYYFFESKTAFYKPILKNFLLRFSINNKLLVIKN